MVDIPYSVLRKLTQLELAKLRGTQQKAAREAIRREAHRRFTEECARREELAALENKRHKRQSKLKLKDTKREEYFNKRLEERAAKKAKKAAAKKVAKFKARDAKQAAFREFLTRYNLKMRRTRDEAAAVRLYARRQRHFQELDTIAGASTLEPLRRLYQHVTGEWRRSKKAKEEAERLYYRCRRYTKLEEVHARYEDAATERRFVMQLIRALGGTLRNDN